MKGGRLFQHLRSQIIHIVFPGCLLCNESGGFQSALACLEEWLGSDHPDLFEMCRTLLIHEVYLFLPLSYESQEGEQLALNIAEEVSGLMDDGETYRNILDNNKKN